MNASWDGTLTGDDRVDDTLQSFKTIRAIQASNGPKGAHRYIISNCPEPWMWLVYLHLRVGPPLAAKR